eukprot:CAMPEP_0173205624 /NCGR_PEP_ID=MMETSP1141-20130122/20863_1 /TAXON_ID=483371 /ORGANISM="non described non described, Strain CCMP2298" /LENGTH=801 /DNA_ID=CAMNT_0014131583 /DNA_START=1 /DNA_END=2402 /DNA_ORIENTATION=+
MPLPGYCNSAMPSPGITLTAAVPDAIEAPSELPPTYVAANHVPPIEHPDSPPATLYTVVPLSRPPNHPSATPSKPDLRPNSDRIQLEITTPTRASSTGSERGFSGPLNVFSPGLSPIGQSRSYAHNQSFEVAEAAEAEADGGQRVEQLERQGLGQEQDHFQEEQARIALERVGNLTVAGTSAEQARAEGALLDFSPTPCTSDANLDEGAAPVTNYWKGKLFRNESGDVSVDSEVLVWQAIEHPKAESPASQVHYPLTSTATAVRDCVESAVDLSIDSDVCVTKQSLIYPTSESVYASSTHTHNLSNLSIDSDGKESPIHTANLVKNTAARSHRPPDQLVFPATEGVASLLNVSNVSLFDTRSFDNNSSMQSISLLLPATPVRPWGLHGIPSTSSASFARPSAEVQRRRAGHHSHQYPHQQPHHQYPHHQHPHHFRSDGARDLYMVTSSDSEVMRVANSREGAEDWQGYGSDNLTMSPAFAKSHRAPPSHVHVPVGIATRQTARHAVDEHGRAQRSNGAVSSHREKIGLHHDTPVYGTDASQPDSPPASTPATAPLAPNPSFAEGAYASLVAGSLFTVVVDASGRTVLLPVLLDPGSGSGGTDSGSGGDDFLPYTGQYRQQFQQQDPHCYQHLHGHKHATLASSKQPWHSYHPTSPEMCGDSGINLRRVLERALGSASKLGNNLTSSSNSSERPPWPARRSPSPLLTPPSPARLATPGSGRRGPLSPADESPFHLSGADGKEQLLLSSAYWQERMLLRNMTSVLGRVAPKAYPYSPSTPHPRHPASPYSSPSQSHFSMGNSS